MYHSCRRSIDGNSTITIRRDVPSPSTTSGAAPRTRYRPPYCSIEAAARARYSSAPRSSRISTSEMTYAGTAGESIDAIAERLPHACDRLRTKRALTSDRSRGRLSVRQRWNAPPIAAVPLASCRSGGSEFCNEDPARTTRNLPTGTPQIDDERTLSGPSARAEAYQAMDRIEWANLLAVS